MTVPLRWLFGALLACGLFASACSGSDSGDDLLPPVTTEAPVETTASTEAEPEPEAVDPLAGASEEDLAALWQTMWEASALPADDRSAAVDALGGALDPEVAVGVPQMMPETIERDVFTFPVFDGLNADGRMEIRDCILYVPAALQSVGHVHSGTASPDGEGGWVIDAIQRESPGCVPGELNDEVLADYTDYREAQAEYWNPADPDHPGIEATTTAGHRELTQESVSRGADEGFVLIGDETYQPEVVEVLANHRIEVQDCVEVDPQGGVFDTNGDRLEGTTARIAGQRDLYTMTMTLEDGQWKVDEISSIRLGERCEFAPTVFAESVVR